MMVLIPVDLSSHLLGDRHPRISDFSVEEVDRLISFMAGEVFLEVVEEF